jgi:hypothetical protein
VRRWNHVPAGCGLPRSLFNHILEPEMKKLKLDLDEISVETFSTSELAEKRATLVAHETGELCTSDCTGIGVECYTANPEHDGCTGTNHCDTVPPACTWTGCTVDNVTCVNC